MPLSSTLGHEAEHTPLKLLGNYPERLLVEGY